MDERRKRKAQADRRTGNLGTAELLSEGALAPVAIRRISARGALLHAAVTPPLGARAALRHPVAGIIDGTIGAITPDGLLLAFRPGVEAVAFALAAIAADMNGSTRR